MITDVITMVNMHHLLFYAFFIIFGILILDTILRK